MTSPHRLGDLVDVFDGPHATPKKTEDGPVFLGISNLVGGRVDLTAVEHLSEEDYVRWTRRIEPRHGDVVFSYETRLGEAAAIPNGLRCCLGRRMGLLRPKPGRIDPRFLLYSYLSPEFQEVLRSRTVHGSTVDRIPLIEMPDFPIRILPIPQQQAIASVLGALDDKIELNCQTNETLEELARTIFKSWFVDFDPVRAKADGHQPFGMDAETAKLFPSRFVESELGEIPEGWRVGPVGDAVDVAGGGTPSTTDARYWDGPHCWATPKDLSGHQSPVLLNTARRLTDAGLAKISSGLLPAGTVLLSSRAPIGYTAIAGIPVAVNQGFIAMVCKGTPGKFFVLYWVRENLETIKARANGSTFQEISKRNFRPLPMCVPSPEIGGAFERIAEPVFEAISNNDEEARTLAELRDLLLPKLISGKLGIPDAEKLAEDVA